LASFGASGVFVRLLGPGREASTTVYAQGLYGRYDATVTVPCGGLRGIRLGLRSWVSEPSGTRESDWLLPITNDPFSRGNR
jgi:hypothetical protein